MKIKIIDLLNKIYNKDNIPQKIIYNNCLWEYSDIYNDFKDENKNYFFVDFINYYNDIRDFLESEAEIIEEDKKIEKLKIKDGKITGNWENGNYYCYTLSSPQAVIVNKLNELIDEVNKLKEKL